MESQWEDLAVRVQSKQDNLTAGDNVSISNNVISATDTTYTAGDNISITSNTISFDGGDETISNSTPSTNFQLTAPVSGKVVDMNMYGDTAQTTYTGKNLFSFSAEHNYGGLKKVLQPDGGLKVIGTTDGTWPRVCSDTLFPTTIPNGTTYTFSYTGELPSGVEIHLRMYEELGGAYQATSVTVTNKSVVKTTDRDVVGFQLLFKTTPGITFDTTIYPQLELGSTATEFEPYVGGNPSPSPEYPQKVQTATGRQVVKVEGKNLLNLPDKTYTSNGITAVSKNGTVTFSGTATARVQGFYTDIKKTLDQPMVFSSGQSDLQGVEVKLQYRRNGTTYYPTVTSGPIHLQAGDEVVTTYIIVSSGNTVSGAISPQLETGSEATDFEPYQSNECEINLGKNLLDLKDGAYTNNGVTVVVANGVCTANGTATDTSFVDLPTNSGILTLDANQTYTFSINNDDTITGSNHCRIGNITPSSIVPFTATSGSVTITPSTAQTATNVLIFRTESGTTYNNFIIKPQLELGSKVTSYSPYFTPIELCKIGDYQDYIYKDGDGWYLHKETFKEVPTTLANRLSTDTSGKWRFNFNLGQRSVATNLSAGGVAYSDKLSLDVSQGTCYYAASKNTFTTSATDAVFLAQATTAMTKEEATAWLINNPITFYLPLATATDTQITDSTLISQLEAIGLKTGVNTITVSSEDLPTSLTLSAYADTINGKLSAGLAEPDASEDIGSLKSRVDDLGSIAIYGTTGNNTFHQWEPLYIDAENGSDDNDGLTISTPFATLSPVYRLIERGRLKVDVYLKGGLTYDINGFKTTNACTVHFTPYGSGDVTLDGNETISGSSFSIYNSHFNFSGADNQKIIIQNVGPELYFDGGSISATYTEISGKLSLWGSGARFDNGAVIKGMKIRNSGISIQCTDSVANHLGFIDAESSDIAIRRPYFNTASSSNFNYDLGLGTFLHFLNCNVMIIGASSIDTTEIDSSFSRFCMIEGTNLRLGAALSEAGTTTSFRSSSLYNTGSLVVATSARWTAWKNVSTSSTMSDGSIAIIDGAITTTP